MKNKYYPFIDWKTIHDKEYLYFEFSGILTHRDAVQGIERWDKCFENQDYAKGKVSLIWDCLHMKNYETQARIAWQKAIKKHKHKIEDIWLITNSVNITAGAEIISFFTSFKIRPVKSLKELESKLYV